MAATMAFSDDARQAQDINNRRIEQRMVVLKRDGRNKPFYETGRAAYIAGKPFHPNESDGWCAGWRDAEDEALGRA
jgi:hypothetical protein